MLCAKYDYKTDIAVKQEEAREEKALEAATNALKLGLSDEQIIAITGLSLEKLAELKKQE